MVSNSVAGYGITGVKAILVSGLQSIESKLFVVANDGIVDNLFL